MSNTLPKNRRQRGVYGTQPAEAPGHRTGKDDFAGSNPRPEGELKYLATLVRGQTYRLVYRPGPVSFERGTAVPVNETEFQKLGGQFQTAVYDNDGSQMKRRLPIWAFTDMAGKPVHVEVPPDEAIVRQHA